MTAISPELVERMVEVIRQMDAASGGSALFAEARAIAALMPAPVDPDLVLARKIADRVTDCGYDYHAGLKDAYPIVAGILAGIKRGRELANDGWIVWRGGECPCPGERVEYAMRYGLWCKPEEADELEWRHRGDNQKYGTGLGDIIAYRIVKRAEGGV